MNKICIPLSLLLLLCIAVEGETRKTFERYQIIEVGGVKNIDEEEFQWRMNFGPQDEFEILHLNKIDGTVQVLVRPEIFSEFQDKIQANNYSYNVIAEDVEKLVKDTMVYLPDLRSLNGGSTYERYMQYVEIMDFLQNLQMKHEERVKLITVGHSYKGENMTMVVISDNSTTSENTTKPVIFIEAGIHAREWISVAAAVHLIEQLANSSTLTQDVDWHIIPVSNPDGYKYSWTKNRMWRKNLRKGTRRCHGVDLNRNFGVNWGGPGSSRYPCAELYAGYRSFSEPETQAIVSAFTADKDRTKAFVSIHSFGQYIFIPPASRNFHIPAPCSNIMSSLAGQMANDIRNTTGASFTWGSPIKLVYAASGTTMDWAFAAGNSPLVFNFELRDKGKKGFLLPVWEILPGVTEFWTAMNTLHGVITISPQTEVIASSIENDTITQRQSETCLQNRIGTPQKDKPTNFFSDNPGIDYFYLDPDTDTDSDSESSEEDD